MLLIYLFKRNLKAAQNNTGMSSLERGSGSVVLHSVLTLEGEYTSKRNIRNTKVLLIPELHLLDLSGNFLLPIKSFMTISSSTGEFDYSLVKMLPPYTYTKAIHLKPPRHKTSEVTTVWEVQRLSGAARDVNSPVVETWDHLQNFCKLSVE